MRLANCVLALVACAGCTTTHLGGAYRTDSNDIASRRATRTLDEGSSWPLFWGLFPAGSYDVNHELAKMLRPDEVVTGLEVRERTSVGGFFLWLVTAGIVTHHTIEVRGSIAVVNRPAAGPATTRVTPAREREREVIYYQPDAPPGAEYDRGYRDAYRDRTTGELGTHEGGRTSDYTEGYREGYRAAPH